MGMKLVGKVALVVLCSGLYRDYRGYIGIMEKKMATTMMDDIGYILGSKNNFNSQFKTIKHHVG